ncbi:MAG: ABC transporter permease [Limisphaerales bacterium]
MRQFATITANAFTELVRQPVFLILMAVSAAFILFLSNVYYFTLGDDPQMTKDSILAVIFLTGLFGAAVGAATSVAHEIRSGTALAVLSKPVGRATFLLAKFAGVALALTLLTYTSLLAALLAGRMAFTSYGEPNLVANGIFYGAMVLAFALAGFTNYFLNRPFVSDAVLALAVAITLAFFIINRFVSAGFSFAEGYEGKLDPRMPWAVLLILFALWVLAGIAVACATRLDLVPTLAICTAVFLLGLTSDYFFGRRAAPAWQSFSSGTAELQAAPWNDTQKQLLLALVAKHDTNRNERVDRAEAVQFTAEERAQLRAAGLEGRLWARVVHAVVPNWQVFWIADALAGKKPVPPGYVARAAGYMVFYLGAALAVALLLFDDRELS